MSRGHQGDMIRVNNYSKNKKNRFITREDRNNDGYITEQEAPKR